MRYRMEKVENDLVIRNVETDTEAGSLIFHWIEDSQDVNRSILLGRTLLSSQGDEIETFSPSKGFNSPDVATIAVANFEAHYGYPGLKDIPKNPDPYRVERQLGTLLADAATEIARGAFEYLSGGVKAETRAKAIDLTVKIHGIWQASRFDSFDAERRVTEPYFSRGRSRMSFAEAAQYYGMYHLRTRFPDGSETKLKEALSWPLEVLTQLVNRLSPKPNPPQTI